MRGVLLSRGITRGCVAQHNIHVVEGSREGGIEEGNNARGTRVGVEREIEIEGDGKSETK